jgi:L-arabinokinase
MTIAYYITAHGFGHFVRSAAIIKALPAEIPLAVRTDISPWFLHQELAGRNYTLDPGGFDCGTLGGDSTSVDIAATFQRAVELEREVEVLQEAETAFLKSHGVRVVVCDTPAFPLRVARAAGIPSVLITNFTWVEIYTALAEQAGKSGRVELARDGWGLVEKFRRDYAEGDLLLIPGLDLKMGACRRQMRVPVIARTGQPRRALLCKELGLNPAIPIYLIYVGQDGYAGMAWPRIREIPNAQFVSFKPPPEAEGTVHAVPKGLMDHSDATATVDAVIGKLGYSLCAECLATRRPLIFPPRPDFVEAVALGKGMIEAGLGVPLEAEAFRNLEWRAAIQKAHELAATAQQVDCSGAQICAEILAMAWREGSLKGFITCPHDGIRRNDV